MPKQRIEVTVAQRVAAYEHAIHDLANTIAAIQQAVQLGREHPDRHPADEIFKRVENLATGRLAATTEALEPIYRGFRKLDTNGHAQRLADLLNEFSRSAYVVEAAGVGEFYVSREVSPGIIGALALVDLDPETGKYRARSM